GRPAAGGAGQHAGSGAGADRRSRRSRQLGEAGPCGAPGGGGPAVIVCRKCGFHNGDKDTFCGSCGEFLEWTGEKITPKVTVPPEPEPDEPQRKKGLLERVQSLMYLDVGEREKMERPAGPGMRPGMPGGPPGGPPG